jgi:hypothetical protein
MVAIDDVISALPSVEDADLSEIAKCYDLALRRVLGCTPPANVYSWVRTMPLFAVCGGVITLGEVSSLTHGSTPVLAGVLVAVAYAFLLALIGAWTILQIYRWAPSGYVIDPVARRDATKAVRLVAIATILASASPLTGLPISILAVKGYHYAIDGLLLLFFLVLIIMSNLGGTFGRRYLSGGPLRPLDRVGTRMVALAVEVNRCARDADEVTAGHVRSLIRDLEMLARDAERFAVARVPWWDYAARNAVQADGLRLATVVRRHKPLMASAASADDFAALARSLTSGGGAWAKNDLITMVRDTPQIKAPRTLTKLLTRLGPPVLLTGMAIVVPLLPPLNHAAQAAGNFRAALFIGAALSLFGGTAQIADYVTTALERSIPSR